MLDLYQQPDTSSLPFPTYLMLDLVRRFVDGRGKNAPVLCCELVELSLKVLAHAKLLHLLEQLIDMLGVGFFGLGLGFFVLRREKVEREREKEREEETGEERGKKRGRKERTYQS